MAKVTFNEEAQYTYARPELAAKPDSIIGLMFSLGFAKTKRDANLILGCVIVACFILSATMLMFVAPHQDPAHAAQLEQDMARMQAYQSQHPSQ